MKRPGNIVKTPIPTLFYIELRQKEISSLLEKGAFKFVNVSEVPKDTRIFGSQFVNEIKNSGTNKAYEKSRLVM